MAFFKRRVKVADVYVITAMVISSYNNGKGCGPMCADIYLLAKYKKGEYYELFSGKKLENKDASFYFNTPYVEKAESLKKYLKNPNKLTMNIQDLFYFITNKNVLGILGAFDEDDEEEYEEDQ
mgnify:CR=1 FL=1